MEHKERCFRQVHVIGKGKTMGQEIQQGVLYLKKCVIALKWAERLAQLRPLCERLAEAGVGCQAMLSEELAKYREEAGLPSPQGEEGVLYLTDDPGAYAMLSEESGEEPSVLIYLHPDNANEDFGNAKYAMEEPEETETEYLERVYRRCHDLPWEILVTERCWLRETVEEDVGSFWEMYQAPELTRYTERLYPTPEAERRYVREYRRLVYSFYEYGIWTVLDRRSGAVVGRAGLSIREGYDLPELGFVIGRDWQRQGLAGEVCGGILDHARKRLGFERIQVLVHEENSVSLHLCRKLGFQEQAPPNAAESCGGGQSGKKTRFPLVEMEQNGRRERFVYMVYHSPQQESITSPLGA